MTLTYILFAFAVVGGTLGIVSFFHNRGREKVSDTKEDVKEYADLKEALKEFIQSKLSGLEGRIRDIELDVMRRCTKLETQLEINAAVRLHKPHEWAQRRDQLLDKHIRSLRDSHTALTIPELREFIVILEGVIDGRLADNGKDLQAQEDARYLLERLRDRYKL